MAKSGKHKPHPLFPSLQAAFGLLSCVLALAVPFFPDEKISRLKLLSLEGGIFVLLLLSVLYWAAEGFSWIKKRSARVEGGVLLIWAGLFGILGWMTAEGALASAEIRRILLGACAFLVFRWGPWSEEWRSRFIYSFSFGVILISLYGILQKFGGVSVLQVPQMERVMGTFGNPIFFAAYLVCGFFFLLSARSLSSGIFKHIFSIGLLLVLAALFFTHTRAAWIALALSGGAGLMMAAKNWEVPAWGWGALIVGAGLFLAGTQDTWKRDQGHLLIWRDTARMALQHPVSGTGLGTFHTRFPEFAGEDLKAKWPKGQFIVNYAHNEYLQVFSETGFLGLGAFLGLLGVLLFRMRRKVLGTGDPSVKFLALGAVSLLIQNLFSVDFRFSITFALFFMTAGIVLCEPLPEGMAGEGEKIPPTFFFSLPVVALIGFLGGAFILKPYLANREVNRQTAFFDERLLDPAKTIGDLEKLKEEYPDEPAVLERLAYSYAKEMRSADGNINPAMAEKAVRAYGDVVRVSTGSVGAWNNYGNVLYTMGRKKEAIEKWKRVLEIQPDFLDVLLNMGKIHYASGDLKDAAAYFERALEVDPGNAEAIVYLKRMVE